LIFGDLCNAAKDFYTADKGEMHERVAWLANRLDRDDLRKYGVRPDMWLLANLAEAGHASARDANPGDAQRLEAWCWAGLSDYSQPQLRTLEAIKWRTYRTASVLRRMEQTNRKIATTNAQPLPTDKTELVKYGRVSVIALAGYTGDFQATIYSLIADAIFGARVSDNLKLPVLLVLEEAHNFAPGKATTAAEERAIAVTRQIAQEGRKFQVGLLMISQRPNRLDETALSMCNSYVIMKMINPADQNFVRRVVESLGEDDVRMLTNLDKGEAILTGEFISFPVLVKVKPPASRGEREEEDAFVALDQMKTAADEVVKAARSGKP
ncbi:MAG: ATP-binding protein, partial [Verrucomicrobia bacterium]|nr:ATP-binding protein [Verrucomicrobiota bacterium]